MVFNVVSQTADRHVVIPDLHGEHVIAEQAVDRYIDQEDIGFVFLGDVLDKKGLEQDHDQGVRRTLELIRSLGNRAVLTIANHEIYALAAMFSKHKAAKQAATELWLGNADYLRMERNTVSAYDITERSEETPELFRSALEEHGHLDVLISATPYFETDTFVALHAGVMPHVDWQEQRDTLIDTARDMAHGIYFDTPPQWFSLPLAVDITPIESTDKIVVTGHAHYLSDSRKSFLHKNTNSERSINGGKRIRLASMLNNPQNENLFVWQDWDGEIIEIPRDQAS